MAKTPPVPVPAGHGLMALPLALLYVGAMRSYIAAVALLLSSAPLYAASPREEEKGEPIEYGCGDVVVRGRIETLSYTSLSGPDDILGYGLFRTQVHVKRMIKGLEKRKLLPMSLTAHSQVRSDRDFLIVLRPSGEGQYTLAGAKLWRDRPKPVLADRCDDD